MRFFPLLLALLLTGCRTEDRKLAESWSDELYFQGKNTPAEFATDIAMPSRSCAEKNAAPVRPHATGSGFSPV